MKTVAHESGEYAVEHPIQPDSLLFHLVKA